MTIQDYSLFEGLREERKIGRIWAYGEGYYVASIDAISPVSISLNAPRGLDFSGECEYYTAENFHNLLLLLSRKSPQSEVTRNNLKNVVYKV